MKLGKTGRSVRLGIIGLGGRGLSQMDLLLTMPDVEIVAVCDRYEDRIRQAQEHVQRERGSCPAGTADYREVNAREDIEAVVIMTSWTTHILIAVDAMKQGKIPAMEVGGASSIEECWQLVRTSEKTGIPVMLLENCCYGKEEMTLLNMIRQGVFGEIIHCRGGYMHDLREEIGNGDLDRHYRDVLPRARLELFYCGSAPQDRVREAFSAAFAALPRRGALEPVETLCHPLPEQCRTVTEEMDVAQGKLCIGYTTDSEDRMATRLMNSMFGGSATSKLFTNVREKLSLCYYAGSTYHRSKGIITVSAGIEQENYRKTLDEIIRQLEAMASGRWEDWELEAARTSLLSGLRTMEDSAGALEDYAMNRAVTGAESLEELRTGLIEVTPERVRAAAAALRIDTIYFLKGKEAQ